MLTTRMLEEKNKMVEMLNEANSVFEQGANLGMRSGTMAMPSTNSGSMIIESPFEPKTKRFSIVDEGDFTHILKPEYLS